MDDTTTQIEAAALELERATQEFLTHNLATLKDLHGDFAAVDAELNAILADITEENTKVGS